MSERAPKKEKEFSIEESKRIEFLIHLFENGLNSENIIAYHGTSIQAIDQIIRGGVLRGSRYDDKYSDPKGHLYVFPTLDYLKQYSPEYKIAFPEEYSKLEERAGGYAGDRAREYYLAEKLGIDMVSESGRDDLDEILFAGLTSELRQKYFAGGQLSEPEKLFKEMETRKGVVLGLHKDLLEKYQIKHDGKQQDDGWYIDVKNGLDYKLLCGIEPLGQVEWDFFTDLKKKL